MANEISLDVRFSVNNGNLVFNHSPGTVRIDQAAIGGPTPGYSSIGTAEESVSFSELSTAGWLVLQNLDSTNFVDWGFSTGTYGGRLEAGEQAAFRLKPSTTLYLKADTAACGVQILAFED